MTGFEFARLFIVQFGLCILLLQLRGMIEAVSFHCMPQDMVTEQ